MQLLCKPLFFLFAVAKIASTTVIMFFTFKNCFFYIYGTPFLVIYIVLTFEYVDTKYYVTLLCGHLNKNPVQQRTRYVIFSVYMAKLIW